VKESTEKDELSSKNKVWCTFFKKPGGDRQQSVWWVCGNAHLL